MNDKRLRDLVHEMTGGASESFEEAFQQWKNERKTMAELFDENQAYGLLNRRLLLALALAVKTITAADKDASMFVTDKTRALFEQFREKVTEIDNTIKLSKELNDG